MERRADSYRVSMGYEFASTQDGTSGEARDRRLQLTLGSARTLEYAAFKVASPEQAISIRERVVACGHNAELRSTSGWTGPVCAVRDPDGNTLLFGVPDGGPSVSTDLGRRPARLQHVVFASTDIDAMLRFYRDTVGFGLSDRVVDEAGELKTIFLRCSQEHHSLAIFAASTSRLDHWCHEAEDWNALRDWADHFAKFDLPLQWGSGRHGPGNNLFLFVHDLDGNWGGALSRTRGSLCRSSSGRMDASREDAQ